MAGRRNTPRPSRGPLPAPPRQNLMLVKDDLRRSLVGLPQEEAVEKLRQVIIESMRNPTEGGAGPYVAALQEMQGDKASSLINAAGTYDENTGKWTPGVSPVFESVLRDPTMDDLLAAPPLPTIDPESLSPNQAEAVRQIVELASTYERAKSEALSKFAQMTPEQQARTTQVDALLNFETSAPAQAIRSQIEDLVILNDLENSIPLDDETDIGGMIKAITPTLADLPAATGRRNYRPTRADFPMGDKLSTYAGPAAENHTVGDDPLKGKPAGQFRKLAGKQAKEILVKAGWPATMPKLAKGEVYRGPTPVNRMSDEEIYRRVTELEQQDGGATRVRSPNGDIVQVTLPKIQTTRVKGEAPDPPTASQQIAALESRLAQEKAMPALAGVEPKVAQAQAQNRSNLIAALQKQIADLRAGARFAPGDSPEAVQSLMDLVEAIEQLPVDPNVRPFDHVIDRSFGLTGDEINALPMEVRRAYAAGQIGSLEQLQQMLSMELEGPPSAMVGPTGERRVPDYRARGYKDDEGEIARRSGALAARQTPYANVVEQVAHRMSTEGPRFAGGMPVAVESERQRANLVSNLLGQIAEMQARMGNARPPVETPEMQTVRMTSSSNPNALRSPAQSKMEFWLGRAGKGSSELSGLTVDPVTGQRVMEGDGVREMGAAPEPPTFAMQLYPQVDADGNVTHPYQPPSGELAARNFAWALGAKTDDFARDIAPLMQQSLDQHWDNYVDARGMPGHRKEFMPNKSGLDFLQQQAVERAGLTGGGGGGGSMQINIQTRPQRIDDMPTPSLQDLANMPVEEMAPNTPPPQPRQFKNAMEELEALERMGVDGDMEEALGPGVTMPSLDDINSELNIPMDEDDTGFLGRTSMNRMPRRELLAGLIA